MIAYPRNSAEVAAIRNAAELIKELLSDPRNVIVGRHAILLWNAETQLRAMVEPS